MKNKVIKIPHGLNLNDLPLNEGQELVYLTNSEWIECFMIVEDSEQVEHAESLGIYLTDYEELSICIRKNQIAAFRDDYIIGYPGKGDITPVTIVTLCGGNDLSVLMQYEDFKNAVV